MSDKPIEHGRRRAIKFALGGIVAIPLANVLLRGPAEAAAMVSPSMPQAKQLQYTENSTKKGELCSNCSYYGGSGSTGPCTIFGGKTVVGKGWCSSWMAG